MSGKSDRESRQRKCDRLPEGVQTCCVCVVIITWYLLWLLLFSTFYTGSTGYRQKERERERERMSDDGREKTLINQLKAKARNNEVRPDRCQDVRTKL